jgi:large subunit ribosomal protein L32e
MNELLKEKQIIKKKTPDFIRTAGKSKVRLKKSGWRRPKGITNKMRLQEHGHRAIVKKGYGTPSEIRGIGKDGRTQILVTNINDLKKVGKNDKAIIASTLGLKKKIQIIEEAKKLKVEIVNINDDKISRKLEAISSRRQEQKNKKDKREKKKQAADKKTDKEKKPVDEKISEEEQKKEDKKEKDNILTHKD